jgi:Tfp pilus assembly protein PilF
MKRGTSIASTAWAQAVWRICVALSLAAMTPGLLWPQAEHGGVISGEVFTTRGKSERLLVQLVDESGIPAGEMYTDSNGGFVFRSLPNGVYAVVIQVEGYQPFRQVIRLDLKLGPKVQMNVQLEPVAPSNPPPNPAVPGSPQTYKLNLGSRTRPINPNALREFDKANEARNEGNSKSAIRHYKKALQIDSSCFPALNNLGAVYLRQGMLDQAKEAFARSVELNPEDSEGYINLGHALYQEGRFEQAAARLEEGLRLDPQSGVGRFFLGSAYLKLNRLGDAEANLKAASVLDRSLFAVHLQLANLYLKRRDKAAAGSELEIYLRANPSDPQAPAIMKTLANLKER